METESPAEYYSDWFGRHAITRPNVVAIAAPEAKLTYAEFHRALHRAAHRLAESGIERGQIIGVCVPNEALHFVLLAALNRMGCVTMGVRPPTSFDADIEFPQNVALDRILVEGPFTSALAKGALRVDRDWLDATKDSIPAWTGEGFLSSDSVSHIFASSGTTGADKAVALSSRMLQSWVQRHSFANYGEGYGGKVLVQFGFRTAIAHRAILGTFWAGGTAFLGWPAAAVPAHLAKNAITRIEASPVQYKAILQALDTKERSFPALRRLVVAGSAPPRPLVAAIRARLGEALFNEYGSTEIGLTSFGILHPRSAPGHCGFLAPWVEAEVVDDDGIVLPAGNEGNLRFRHDSMPRSYLNDPAATQAHFKDGWFYPDDIGSVSEERGLTISGRRSERINAGGLKISPNAVEDVVLSLAGIDDCAVFGLPDALGLEQVAVAYVAKRATKPDALRAHCDARLGLGAPRKFIQVESIPRNAADKILRAELPKLVKVETGLRKP
jgi:acyl-coenzyme A synthetase/AMP-(fatty) acid ligase